MALNYYIREQSDLYPQIGYKVRIDNELGKMAGGKITNIAIAGLIQLMCDDRFDMDHKISIVVRRFRAYAVSGKSNTYISITVQPK